MLFKLRHVAVICTICALARAAPPTSAPSTHTFVDTSDGVQLSYPGDWKPEKGKTAVLDVVAPATASTLCLDVPHLPPHFPGMITFGMVERGYVNDLQKKMPDLKQDPDADIKVAGGDGRLIKCSGHESGKPAVDVAVICFHHNRVYILSCDSDDTGYSAARAALDSAVQSWTWLK